MKVLNLGCERQHRFEGWFSSEGDYQAQQDGGLLSCPMCDSRQVVRLPTAARLKVSKAAPAAPRGQPEAPVDGQARQEVPSSVESPGMAERQVQGALWQAVQHVLRNTEDVGDRFPEEARRIHYGEAKERGIRGRASPEEAHALKEEGIEVASLPLPDGLKKPLQ